MGRGHLRAKGQPRGGPWRQLWGEVCRYYFLETLGPLCHGTRASVERSGRVIACLAEGLGIWGTARGVEGDPHTVRQWRIEAAEQRQALARQVLPAGRIPQVHRDALFALRSAADASEGLARPPQWGWVAMDPESTWLLAIDVGDRPRAMVQRVGHQGAQGLAPDCAPLLLPDGLREDRTAVLTHYGSWGPPPRRQATGPAPKPRWLPLPSLR